MAGGFCMRKFRIMPTVKVIQGMQVIMLFLPSTNPDGTTAA